MTDLRAFPLRKGSIVDIRMFARGAATDARPGGGSMDHQLSITKIARSN